MTDDPSVSQQAQGSYIAQATHGGMATVQVVLPPAPVQEQNRVRFLARLRSEYDELWKQSLQGAALLTLGLTEKPDAVLHHTGLLFRSPQQPECPLPPGTSITEVYDKAGHELLILGEPGAGKSTLLLDLARQLVGRAGQDAGHPLPIIFLLSSWATKPQPLQDWLSAQLSLIYDVPLQLSRAWVFTDQILPLLDGLDEVPQEARLACIEAITTYRKEHLVPLVVCSRRTEYEEIERQKRLVLQTAVVVQPLTRQQVETYLDQAGQSLAAVRTVLQANPVLQELTTTPLMLSVLTLTYIGANVQDLPQRGSAEVQQQQVFASYVERMVERKGNVERYPLQSTQAWLGWLARQMREHNQSVFYLEYLQPDWLPAEQQRWYTWLAVRLPGALIGVFVGLLTAPLLITFDPGLLFQYSILSGFLGALFSVPKAHAPTHGAQHRFRMISGRLTTTHLVTSAVLGLVWGAVFMLNMHFRDTSDSWLLQCMYSSASGVTIGLSCLLLMILLPQATPKEVLAIPQNKGWWSRLRHIVSLHRRPALLAAIIFGMAISLSDTLNAGLSAGLSNGLSAGLSYGLLSVMVSVILGMLSEDIHPAERLKWTRRSLLPSLFNPKHLRSTLAPIFVSLVLFGLSQGLGPWLDQGLSQGLSWGLSWGLGQGLGWGLSWGLSCWLLLGLFQGVSHEQVKDQDRRLFNQGIRDSLRNSAFVSISSAILIGVISVLSWGLSYELSYGLNYGLSWGLSYELSYELGYGLNTGLNQGLSHAWLFAVSGGLLVGAALSGGLAVLRHYVLRFLLWRAHTFPWKAQPFLEDAGRRILLRCIDGKYSFTHRLLLDYFADLACKS